MYKTPSTWKLSCSVSVIFEEIKENIKYLELNDYKNKTAQTFWGSTKQFLEFIYSTKA